MTKWDFVHMTDQQLIGIWENGTYLYPDEMGWYLAECAMRNIIFYVDGEVMR